jgi:hypothetical protein
MDEGAKLPFALGPKHSVGGPAPVFNQSFSGIHIAKSLVFWVGSILSTIVYLFSEICHSTLTHCSDSEPTSLCSSSLMLCA